MTIYLSSVEFLREKYPTGREYPYNVPVIGETEAITFHRGVTLFVGENGSVKSTVLRAITRGEGVHIWDVPKRRRMEYNRFEDSLHHYFRVNWKERSVPGSFFASEHFRNYSELIEEWSSLSPAALDSYGGESLVSRSHGQSHTIQN